MTTLRKQLDEVIIQRDNFRSEMIDIKRAKNNLVEEKATLERSVSSLVGEKAQLEAVLKDIQRDMRTACELMYGADFDPSNIERLMPMMHNGVEYVPRTQGGEPVGGYVEPIQRLVRLIWRHTHWGLNPLILRDYGAERF